jgi:hypothetical protein
MQLDQLKRREFIALLGGTAISPRAAFAQTTERSLSDTVAPATKSCATPWPTRMPLYALLLW